MESGHLASACLYCLLYFLVRLFLFVQYFFHELEMARKSVCSVQNVEKKFQTAQRFAVSAERKWEYRSRNGGQHNGSSKAGMIFSIIALVVIVVTLIILIVFL